MAKKLPWGSFTHKDLVLKKDDDPVAEFPYLELAELGMNPVTELSAPNENTTRGTAALIPTRTQAIFSSIKCGWDRASWPIPFVLVDNRKEIFDRRHTFASCQQVADSFTNILDLPTARYKRVYNPKGGLINKFSDKSISMIVSVYCNVNSPVPENVKDHEFIRSIIRILKHESTLGHTPKHELYTLDLCKQIFKEMGGYERYEDPRTLSRIPNNAHTTLLEKDEEDVGGTNTINNNFISGHKDNSIDKFIFDNDGWQQHNSSDDTTHYSAYAISKTEWHTKQTANAIIDKCIELERTAKESGERPKKSKVLVYNENQANQANMIVKSRNVLKNCMNKVWYTRRDSVLDPVEGVLVKDMIPRKLLSEFDLEIWVLNQLEGEEPYELTYDLGGWPAQE